MSRICSLVQLRFWQLGCGALLCLSVTAPAADKIQVYRVPKERSPASDSTGGHSADDGHDHGAHENPREPGALPKISYTTPAGWRDIGAGEMRVAGFAIAGTNGQSAQVAVTPLPGMAGRESLIVNMWRQQVGLGELSDEDTAKQLTMVDIGGATGKMFDMKGQSAAGANIRIVTAMLHRDAESWFFKLQGDDELVVAQKPNFLAFLKSVKIEEAAAPELPAGHPPLAGAPMMPGAVTEQRPPKPRQGGPTWTIPAGWKEIDGGQFLFTKFVIAGEAGEQATVNVSTSAGDGGGLAANVNRWLGQLGLPPWSEAELQQHSKEIATDGGPATFVEMRGADARTGKTAVIVGAMVTQGGATWFYKMMGDEKLVTAQKEAFTRFVKEVKY